MTRNRGRLLGTAVMVVLATLGAASCAATQPAGLAVSTQPPAEATRQAGSQPPQQQPQPPQQQPQPPQQPQPQPPQPPQQPPPQQRAEQDAAAILAAFVAPPGARRLAAPPAGLNSPSDLPATPDLVDKAGWWQVAGDPRQVLDRAKAHVPHRFTLDGSGTLDRGTGTIWSDDFGLPAVPGVLLSRQLTVATTSAGSGQTAIRVDAQVTWLPARAPGERIPAGATAVTLSLTRGATVNAKPPATVTGQATVRKLTALIDGLPLFPAGAYSCPNDNGASLVLTFRAGRGGPVLAVATVKLAGCEEVDLTIGGQQQPTLGPVAGGQATAVKAVAIAGLNWSV